jgi:hypothetical protein
MSKVVEQAKAAFLEELDDAQEVVVDSWKAHVEQHQLKGGKGSGHKGHAGRPGKVGGSIPGTGGMEARILSGNVIVGDEFQIPGRDGSWQRGTVIAIGESDLEGQVNVRWRGEGEDQWVDRREFEALAEPIPGEEEWLGEDYVTVWHATHDEYLDSIQANGLVINESSTYDIRPPSVYFMTSREEAIELGGSWLGHSNPEAFPPGHTGGYDWDARRNIAIVSFKIPKSMYDSEVIIDKMANKDFQTSTAARIERNIPASMLITFEYLTFVFGEDPESGRSFPDEVVVEWTRDISVQEKEEYVTCYYIVAFDPDTEVEKQLPIDQASKATLLTIRRNMFLDFSDDLAEQLYTGEISIGQWQEAFKQELRQLYTSSAAIGNGGWDEMTFADWGRLGPLMKDQYRYLQGFAEHIADNADDVSLKYIKARSRMYGEGAAGGSIIIEAGVVFEALLPYMPRDGSSECLNRCHCRWVNTIIDKKGDWNIVQSTWQLGEADHCATCVGRNGHVEVNRVHKTVDIPPIIGGY